MANRSKWSRAASGTRVAGVIGAVALTSLAGCFGLSRGETVQEHYVLGSGAVPRLEARAEAAELTLGIRRLQLDAYLRTPLIVVRRGAHQVSFSESHRWGEPLEGGIVRAVAGHLAEGGSLHRVEVAPWSTGLRVDYLVQLNVSRFEGVVQDSSSQAAGEAHLRATWEVIRQQDGAVVARGDTEYLEGGWVVGDYASLVTLLDAGLKVLADDLAAAIHGRSAPAYPLRAIPPGGAFH